MVRFLDALTLAATLLAGIAAAHPGHDANSEYAQRAAYLASLEERGLGDCSQALQESGHVDRAVQRRRAILDALRRDAGLDGEPLLTARDITQVLNTNHRSSQPYNLNTPDTTIFASNGSCVLSPEITEGPFYVSGELIRQNLTDGQAGVPMHLELELIDSRTCKPITGAHLEIWSCNATGVYSGVVNAQNGNVNDVANINRTALRGVQPTDANGVVSFNTLVPGHYIGRANHVHVLSHIGATVLPNNTLSGGTLSHVGQIYFDQSLLDTVETTSPYSTNTQAKTSNAQDLWMAGGAANNADPVVNYVLLGSDVTKGLLGWITLVMDPTAQRTIVPATWYGADGGVKNPSPLSVIPIPGFTGFPWKE